MPEQDDHPQPQITFDDYLDSVEKGTPIQADELRHHLGMGVWVEPDVLESVAYREHASGPLTARGKAQVERRIFHKNQAASRAGVIEAAGVPSADEQEQHELVEKLREGGIPDPEAYALHLRHGITKEEALRRLSAGTSAENMFPTTEEEKVWEAERSILESSTVPKNEGELRLRASKIQASDNAKPEGYDEKKRLMRRFEELTSEEQTSALAIRNNIRYARAVEGTAAQTVWLHKNLYKLGVSNIARMSSGMPNEYLDELLAHIYFELPELRQSMSTMGSDPKRTFSREAFLKESEKRELFPTAVNTFLQILDTPRKFTQSALIAGPEAIQALTMGPSKGIAITLQQLTNSVLREEGKPDFDPLMYLTGKKGYEETAAARLEADHPEFTAALSVLMAPERKSGPMVNDDAISHDAAKAVAMTFWEYAPDPLWFLGVGSKTESAAVLQQIAKHFRAIGAPDDVIKSALRHFEKGGKASDLPRDTLGRAMVNMFAKAQRTFQEAPSALDGKLALQRYFENTLGKEMADEFFVKFGRGLGKNSYVAKPFVLFGPEFEIVSPEGAANIATEAHLIVAGTARKIDTLGQSYLTRMLGDGGKGLDDVDINIMRKSVAWLESGIKNVASPKVGTSMSKWLNNYVDEAANRMLDGAMGTPLQTGPELTGAGHSYSRQLGEAVERSEELHRTIQQTGVHRAYQDQLQELLELDEKIEKLRGMVERESARASVGQVIASRMSGFRRRIRQHLGTALLGTSRGARRADIARTRKAVDDYEAWLAGLGENAAAEFPPGGMESFLDGLKSLRDDLDTIDAGGFPKWMQKGYDGRPPFVEPGEHLRAVQQGMEHANAMVQKVQGMWDAFTRSSRRTVEHVARNVSTATRKRGGKLHAVARKRRGLHEQAVLRGEDVDEFDPVLTVGNVDEALDVDPSNPWHQYNDETKSEIVGTWNFVRSELDRMNAVEVSLGIDVDWKEDYLPHVYEAVEKLFGPAESFGVNANKKLKDIIAAVPGGHPDPRMRQSLSLAQAEALSLNPQYDLLKMYAARSLIHDRMRVEAYLRNELIEKFGRKLPEGIDPRAAMIRGEDQELLAKTFEEAVGKKGESLFRRAGKPGKAGKTTIDTFAIPNWMVDAIEQVTGASTGIGGGEGIRVVADANNLVRALFTVPNPGFHIRNTTTNAYMAYAGGIRNPARFSQSILAMSLPHQDEVLSKTLAWLNTIKDPKKQALMTRIHRRRIEATKGLADQVIPSSPAARETLTLGSLRREVDSLPEAAGVMTQGFYTSNFGGGMEASIDEASAALNSKSVVDAYRAIMKPSVMAALGFGASGAANAPEGKGLEYAAYGALAGATGAAAAQGAARLIRPLRSVIPQSMLISTGGKVGEGIESMFRFSMYIDQRARGASPGAAARHVNEFFFDYKTKKKIDIEARKQVLFWTWLRNAIPFVFKEAVRAPRRHQAVHLAKKEIERKADERGWNKVNQEIRPDWYDKIWAWRSPTKTKGGLPKLFSVEIPLRELNVIPMDMDNVSQLMDVITPVSAIGVYSLLNQIAGAGDPLQPGGVIARRPGGKLKVVDSVTNLVPAPEWISALPKWVRQSIGAEYHEDYLAGGSDGGRVKRLYMPWGTLQNVNAIAPGFNFLTAKTTQDLLFSESKSLASTGYLYGYREYAYDPELEKQRRISMALKQVMKQVRREDLSEGELRGPPIME